MSTDTARSFVENTPRSTDVFAGDAIARMDSDMKYMLDALTDLRAVNLQQLMPAEARRQPAFDAALAKRLRDQHRNDFEDQGISTEDIVIAGPEGDIPARVYRGEKKPGTVPPLILYIHGGGWVVGDLDTYDASPRALAKKTGAVVISTHYRQAPEHKFPAAHDDTYAAWLWMIENARKLGATPFKAAVVGEGVGANMALNIAIKARDAGRTQPVHQVLIHPVAGNDMSRPSYVANMRTKPLNTYLMQWYVRHSFANKDDTADPRINLVARNDLAGLPETTIILAEIDPLLSEGEALADALVNAGVDVEVTSYDGVTHDFFGLARFVNKAMFAQSQVAGNLSDAFARARRF
jgi:acetyl esterase/lipase